MKHILSLLLIFSFVACNNDPAKPSAQVSNSADIKTASEDQQEIRHFRGALTGGYKGDSIFFEVNAKGTKLEDLLFKGYWRCNGKMEVMRAAGPEGYFTLTDNKVNDHISEPPDGGATAWRFDLNATIEGKKAHGTFRMNINALGCNTGTLKWEAIAD
jgi:hypothetical protein